jgi:hypothetical protein
MLENPSEVELDSAGGTGGADNLQAAVAGDHDVGRRRGQKGRGVLSETTIQRQRSHVDGCP